MSCSKIGGASCATGKGRVRVFGPLIRPCAKRPLNAGPAPPQPCALRSDRHTAPSQLDPFAERRRMMPRSVPEPAAPPAAAPVEVLSDDDLLESVPKAGLSNIGAVCSEIVSRSMEAAVAARVGDGPNRMRAGR